MRVGLSLNCMVNRMPDPVDYLDLDAAKRELRVDISDLRREFESELRNLKERIEYLEREVHG